MAAQLEITLTKADSEQLARSIAEEQYSDLEKEKIMKELEIKEMMARHKQELTEKDATIASVSKVLGSFLAIIVKNLALEILGKWHKSKWKIVCFGYKIFELVNYQLLSVVWQRGGPRKHNFQWLHLLVNSELRTKVKRKHQKYKTVLSLFFSC